MLAILADDLTGALDASAPFARHGFHTVLDLPGNLTPPTPTSWVPALPSSGRGEHRALSPEPGVGVSTTPLSAGGEGPGEGSHPEVLAVSTESRQLSPAAAAAVARRWTRELRADGAEQLYKKMDSTLRGPWVEELAAVREALGGRPVILCPAFPAQGRVVVSGRVRVGGTVTGDLFAMLGARARMKTGHLPATGDGSVEETVAAIEVARSLGIDCVVADATQESDLDALAAAQIAHGDLLLCGSAGLAAAWARAWSGRAAAPAFSFPAALRWLLIVGSRQPAAAAQLAALREHLTSRCGNDPAVQVLTPDNVLHPLDWGRQLVSWSTGQLFGNSPIAQLPNCLPNPPLEAPQPAFAFSGGETALAALQALGAGRLLLLGEWEPGLPVSQILGGSANGCLCVTKAGGFGDPETWVRLIRETR